MNKHVDICKEKKLLSYYIHITSARTKTTSKDNIYSSALLISALRGLGALNNQRWLKTVYRDYQINPSAGDG